MVRVIVLALLFVSAIFVINSCSVTYYKGPKSGHFDGQRFFDPSGKKHDKNIFDVIKWRVSSPRGQWPDKVELENPDKPPARVEGKQIRISNVGHVTFLIQTDGLNILTDPVWSHRASPLSFIGPKRVIEPGIKFSDLPKIDIVLVSHNHYDHLDLATLKKLWQRDKPLFLTPLGNDTIIKYIDKNINVVAKDWGQCHIAKDGFYIHLAPTQHWSSRGLFDRNKALWGAFLIQSPGGNIYFGSDAGYGDGRYFKQALKDYSKIDIAMLPMGAYKPRWFMEYAHMGPEEMVISHQDLGLPLTIPTHYDVFQLANESYGEAVFELKNILKKPKKHNVRLMKIGESIVFKKDN